MCSPSSQVQPSPSGKQATSSVPLLRLTPIVAKIAFDKLSRENPRALNSANELLRVFMKTDPELTKLERDYPFVECATFADEIKGKGATW